ncbi:MAG TPA: 50S ribosomal protein L9 [Leucothrix mucor]|uniref:Large ribosomal subunit protein bL9 n=1 Tax=Leucothrix mucor TaxID=45248 RepID=A0A7V2WW99_LEUMU|nr:50S ribosomal protein L9 [Leucothrix mucor]
MQVILMERIDNLGALGDIVAVRSGYARNYLVPQRKAKIATKTNLEEFEKIRAELEAAEAKVVTAAQERCDAINNLEIQITANAGPEGKLFGSVTVPEIAVAITEAGHEVGSKEIRMPEGPIRMIGHYEVGVHFYLDIDAVVKVAVANEDGETEPKIIAPKESIGTGDTDEDDEGAVTRPEAEAETEEVAEKE